MRGKKLRDACEPPASDDRRSEPVQLSFPSSLARNHKLSSSRGDSIEALQTHATRDENGNVYLLVIRRSATRHCGDGRTGQLYVWPDSDGVDPYLAEHQRREQLSLSQIESG